MEIVIDSLRKEVNQEDKCDLAIQRALEKGPKRVRIASREELKIEINQYKNISLRLVQMLKSNGIKAPGFSEKAALDLKETGVRIIKEERELGGATDHLEQFSVGDSNLSMGGEGLDDGVANEQQLLNEKSRLEDQIVKMNMKLNDKNEKILELLEMMEDLKVQIYSRDKTVEL